MKERLLAAIRIETTGEEEFFFDRDEHRYFLGRRELPNVTRILDEFFPLKAPAHILEYARHRGTAVHLACELDDKNDLNEDQLDPLLWPYLESWRKFRRSTGFIPDPDGIEIRKYHPVHRYAGTIDRLGYIGKRRVLIDLKTGANYRQYPLQTAAYLNLLSQDEQFNRSRYIVTLKRGGYSCREHPFSNFGNDLALFRSALNLFKFKYGYE